MPLRYSEVTPRAVYLSRRQFLQRAALITGAVAAPTLIPASVLGRGGAVAPSERVNMGFIGLKAFPAAVVGGFGSVPGAIVGGLIIGLVEAFAGRYMPEGFKDVMAYVVVLLMLMLKPNGLFGETIRKKV